MGFPHERQPSVLSHLAASPPLSTEHRRGLDTSSDHEHEQLAINSKKASHGPIAALFNDINWLESSSWDGRKATFFAGSITVYAAGGTGVCAVLIARTHPSSSILLQLTYMSNISIYKPPLDSEHPHVDSRSPSSLSLNVFPEDLFTTRPISTCYSRRVCYRQPAPRPTDRRWQRCCGPIVGHAPPRRRGCRWRWIRIGIHRIAHRRVEAPPSRKATHLRSHRKHLH